MGLHIIADALCLERCHYLGEQQTVDEKGSEKLPEVNFNVAALPLFGPENSEPNPKPPEQSFYLSSD